MKAAFILATIFLSFNLLAEDSSASDQSKKILKDTASNIEVLKKIESNIQEANNNQSQICTIGYLLTEGWVNDQHQGYYLDRVEGHLLDAFQMKNDPDKKEETLRLIRGYRWLIREMGHDIVVSGSSFQIPEDLQAKARCAAVTVALSKQIEKILTATESMMSSK